MKLAGTIEEFGVSPTVEKRQYIAVTLPFGDARKVFKPDIYSYLSRKGEQRQLNMSWVRKLRQEMQAGNYTPRSIAVGLRSSHRENGLEITKGRATITLDDGKVLPLTDGGHFMRALEQILEETQRDFDTAREADTKKEAQGLLDSVLAQPVTALIMLNGDTQKDFINLQLGRPVDSSHMLAIKTQNRMLAGKDQASMRTALEIARTAASVNDSIFHKQVRFDSRGSAPLPISTLCSKGASDIGTSLVGLARVGSQFDPAKPQSAEWLAGILVQTTKVLEKKAPELLEHGSFLAAPPNHTRGSVTLLIGLSICVAYRTLASKHTKPSPQTEGELVASARDIFGDKTVSGNFSGPAKRALLNQFATSFFADLKEDKKDGVPVKLMEILAYSAFGVQAPAKEKGKKNLPDVDGQPAATKKTRKSRKPEPVSEEVAEVAPVGETTTEVSEEAVEAASQPAEETEVRKTIFKRTNDASPPAAEKDIQETAEAAPADVSEATPDITCFDTGTQPAPTFSADTLTATGGVDQADGEAKSEPPAAEAANGDEEPKASPAPWEDDMLALEASDLVGSQG